MGDAPRPNASTADGTQHPYRRPNNHRPLLQEELSTPFSLASDLQTNYFSRPSHGAARPELPFFDSQIEPQLLRDFFSQEEAKGEDNADFLMDDQVSFTTDLLERQPEVVDLNLSLGLGQIDEDMGVAIESNDVNPEVGLGLGLRLGMGSEEFRTSRSTHQPSFFPGLRVDSESHSDQILAPDSLIDWGDIFDLDSFLLDFLGEIEQVFDTTTQNQNGLHLHSDREIEDLELETVDNLSRDVDDETMSGAVEESMNEWRGNPPAAKSVVESLTVVHLSHDEIKENEITCAICWSEICAKEPLRQLPCRHYYHGDCIMSWLDIRNTCPVCRYELPTDDLEYECRRSEMDYDFSS